ncbi:MAG: hypothetical protein ACXAD7_06640, partial [Candidatus Kariarchaeaceae archaeon]
QQYPPPQYSNQQSQISQQPHSSQTYQAPDQAQNYPTKPTEEFSNGKVVEFMYCGTCGTKNSNQDVFCTSCGAKI